MRPAMGSVGIAPNARVRPSLPANSSSRATPTSDELKPKINEQRFNQTQAAVDAQMALVRSRITPVCRHLGRAACGHRGRRRNRLARPSLRTLAKWRAACEPKASPMGAHIEAKPNPNRPRMRHARRSEEHDKQTRISIYHCARRAAATQHESIDAGARSTQDVASAGREGKSKSNQVKRALPALQPQRCRQDWNVRRNWAGGPNRAVKSYALPLHLWTVGATLANQ